MDTGSSLQPHSQQNIEQSGNLSNLAETAIIAWHGLRARIADRRMEFSGRRMEQMDHKDALYADLGELALTGQRGVSPTASGEPAMPRSFAERLIDYRTDAKSQNNVRASIYAYRATKVFGAKSEQTGLGKKDRRKSKRKLVHATMKGRMLASNARIKATDIDAEPLRYGETMHKRTGRNAIKTRKKLNRTIDQPLLSRWRENRGNEAVEDIKRHHHRAERHRSKQEQIRNKRTSRATRQITATIRPDAPHQPATTTLKSHDTQLYDQDN